MTESKCTACDGSGIELPNGKVLGEDNKTITECPRCNGTGTDPNSKPKEEK